MGDYIRSRWPWKTIGVNSWGMKFDEPETLPSLIAMGQKVDYLIDTHDTSRKRDPNYRKKIIQSLSWPIPAMNSHSGWQARLSLPRLEIVSNTGHTEYPVNDKLGRIVALWVRQFAIVT